MVKTEQSFNKAIGNYRTATRSARELSKEREKMLSQVMECANVGSLPLSEVKCRFLDRLEVASDSA